ncbi:hypothetical protein EV182_005673, partial [Spiromyces aspiralis]
MTQVQYGASPVKGLEQGAISLATLVLGEGADLSKIDDKIVKKAYPATFEVMAKTTVDIFRMLDKEFGIQFDEHTK